MNGPLSEVQEIPKFITTTTRGDQGFGSTGLKTNKEVIATKKNKSAAPAIPTQNTGGHQRTTHTIDTIYGDPQFQPHIQQENIGAFITSHRHAHQSFLISIPPTSDTPFRYHPGRCYMQLPWF